MPKTSLKPPSLAGYGAGFYGIRTRILNYYNDIIVKQKKEFLVILKNYEEFLNNLNNLVENKKLRMVYKCNINETSIDRSKILNSFKKYEFLKIRILRKDLDKRLNNNLQGEIEERKKLYPNMDDYSKYANPMAYSDEEIEDDLPNYFYNVTQLKKIKDKNMKIGSKYIGFITLDYRGDDQGKRIVNADPYKIKDFIYDTELKFEEINNLLVEFKNNYEKNEIPITYPVIIDYYLNEILDNSLAKDLITDKLKNKIDEVKIYDDLNKILDKEDLLSIEDIISIRKSMDAYKCDYDIIQRIDLIFQEIKNITHENISHYYDLVQIKNGLKQKENGGKKSRKRKHKKKKRKSTRKKRRKSNKKHR